jgi:hypothetical protein
VIALFLGLLLLATQFCWGAPYTSIAGWALLALYGVLMAIWAILGAFGICRANLCEAAAIHMAILALLGVILTLLAIILLPCFWTPVWWIYGAVHAIWDPIAADCLRRHLQDLRR